MNLNEQIQHVELSLEEAKKIVDLGEAISRLEQNRDFQKVILDGYFGAESKRLAFLTADVTLPPENQQAVWAGIRSIGELRAYLLSRKSMAEVARKEIGDHQETLEELRGEEANAE